MNKKIVYLILSLALLAGPEGLFAFESEDIEWGVCAFFKQTYDDNITSAKKNEQDDFVTELRLVLDGKLEQKTEAITLRAGLAHQFFYDHDSFDNTSEDINLEYIKEFSPYSRMRLENYFRHDYEPETFAEELGRTSGRYSYYKNRFSAEYSKDITKQLSLIADYGFDLDDISRSGQSDSYLHRLGLGTQYFLSSTMILFSGYDFSYRKFDPGTHSTSHLFSAGLRDYFTPQLYIDAKIGGQFLRNYNKESYVKPYLFLKLTDELDAVTTAGLSFTKQYYTNAYTEDLFDYWQVQAELAKQVYERLGLDFSLFYGEGTYTGLDIKDKVKGAQLGLSCELKENISGTVSYRYSETESSLESREYTRNRIAFGIQTLF